MERAQSSSWRTSLGSQQSSALSQAPDNKSPSFQMSLQESMQELVEVVPRIHHWWCTPVLPRDVFDKAITNPWFLTQNSWFYCLCWKKASILHAEGSGWKRPTTHHILQKKQRNKSGSWTGPALASGCTDQAGAKGQPSRSPSALHRSTLLLLIRTKHLSKMALPAPLLTGFLVWK